MPEQTFLTISEVASMVGVSPHTIRAWERRHQVLTPARTSSRQRRYSPRDVELLLQVKRAVSTQGVSLKIAVRTAQGVLTRPPGGLPGAPDGRQPGAEPSWRVVVDVLPYVIVVLGPDGAILDANQGACRTLGGMRESLLGRSLVDYVEPDDLGIATTVWQPPFGRRLDCRMRLRASLGGELYTFDSWPLVQAGEQRLAVIGREVGFNPL
jgi:PAS domain-containing protein